MEHEPNPTQQFAAVVADGRPPLDDALLLIAAHAHPGLDPTLWKHRLDDLAAALEPADEDQLARYCAVTLGLRGNTDDYADPRNSYLNDVIERGLGIPITLSVVMMELGRRVGIELVGVGMPGHFLVRSAFDRDRYWDPFHAYRAMRATDCRALFERVVGPDIPFTDSHLAPTGPLAIVSRVLMNLQRSTISRSDGSVAWVVRLQLCLPGLAARDRHKLAVLLGSLGSFTESAAQLDRVAREADDESLAETAENDATALRARTN